MKSNKDILIIDDEEVILGAISKIVSFEGYTSDISQNVSDALLKLDGQKYKLIICDIMMPGKDGFEFLEILRQKRINTPVVITTGFSTLENAVKALYEGAIGFIPKPFSLEELTSIIKRGFEYGKVFENNNIRTVDNTNTILDFIPCPPRYFRLGFDSWMSKTEEGLSTIGLTDLFLKSIGMVSDIEFMNIEDSIYQGGNCLRITDSNNNCHQLLAPISGRIIDINEKIIVDKSLLEKDPYFNGWIYKMIPSNLEPELQNITPCSSDI